MIPRFPSRFPGVTIWAVLLAGWSIPTAGQQNVLPRATATISGKISFESVPPPNSPVQMSADPYCQQHSADYPTLETVKVSDRGLEKRDHIRQLRFTAGLYLHSAHGSD